MTAEKTKAAERCGRLIAEELGQGPDAARRAEQRQAVVALLTVRPARPWLRYVVVSTAAGVLLAIGLGVFLWTTRPELLELRVDGIIPSSAEGLFVHAATRGARTIQVDVGSSFELDARTSVRVVRARKDEVQLELRSGTLRAEIRGNGRTRWVVSASSYRITVLGTRFTTRWFAESALLLIEVERGRVLVEGPRLGAAGIDLAAGDRLRIDAAADTFAIESTSASPALPKMKGPSAGSVSPSSAPRAPAAREQRAATPPATTPLPEPVPLPPDCTSWRHRAAAGDFVGAVEEAERCGRDRLLATLGPDDLLSLANASRYAHRDDISRQALLELRADFPASPQARTAAFLLARAALDQGTDPRTGIAWFEIYLAEEPTGPLAEEALYRLADACSRDGQADRAKQLAMQYLLRYPDGVFIGSTRALLER